MSALTDTREMAKGSRMTLILEDRAKLLPTITLESGAHPANDGTHVCAMELAAWIAGEEWSDQPQCVCPVIGAFMRSWNDGLPDDKRTALLLPLIPTTIGTRGSDALATRRANMAADWFIRVHTPAWLRLAGLTEQADLLTAMPEITDFAKVPSLLPTLSAIRDDASAARSAVWDAARSAAWDAARDAAWDADRDAAMDAAWDAVWDAAWAAAGAAAAAGDAAWAALASTVTELQASAVDLVKRMCALTEEPTQQAT